MENGKWCLGCFFWNLCLWGDWGQNGSRDVHPGELVIFDENGITYDRYTDDTQLTICSMEYIYFARPIQISRVNVHTARKRMGAQLTTRI